MFGGSFDPFHNGHLAMIESAMQAIKINACFVVPNYQSPEKKNSFFSNNQRIKSIQALCDTLSYYKKLGTQCHCVDYEIKKKEPCYTIDTISYLRTRYEASHWALLIGLDQLLNFHTWKDYKKLLKNFTLIVVQREIHGNSDLSSYIDKKLMSSSMQGLIMLNNDLVKVSSTEIKKTFQQNERLYGVPEAVRQVLEGAQ
tara:strand:+ start:209 stop:805 length:597 start_codon:yes stop_codon:yes gene_type:complete